MTTFAYRSTFYLFYEFTQRRWTNLQIYQNLTSGTGLPEYEENICMQRPKVGYM